MPDTGAPWNIPYVAGTDLVADWPTDNQTMAQAIADALDIGLGTNVVQTVKSDTATTTSTTFAQLMTATITPSSATSKILVMTHITASQNSNTAALFRLVRDGTDINLGDVLGARTQSTVGFFTSGTYSIGTSSAVFLDSPATTSAVVYEVDFARANNAGTVQVNYTVGDSSAASWFTATSSLTLIEVAA